MEHCGPAISYLSGDARRGGTERPPILEGIQHAGQQTLFGVTAAVAM